MTEAEESERRQKETRERTELFKAALDVDDVIAHLLVAEGYAAVEDVADSAVEDLAGTLVATEAVELLPEGKITGRVVAKKFSLSEGASFNGKVEPQHLDAAARVARHRRDTGEPAVAAGVEVVVV